MSTKPYELPEARRKAKADRLVKVDAMFLTGASVPEMVEATGATKPTIYSDLRELGHRIPDGWTEDARARQSAKTAARHERNKKQRKEPERCAVCSERAVDRFRGRWLCGRHLVDDNADPDYDATQREEIMRGFGDCALSEAESRIASIGRAGNITRELLESMRRRGITPRNNSPGGPRRRAESEIVPYKKEWS